jgi:hypothetical protein
MADESLVAIAVARSTVPTVMEAIVQNHASERRRSTRMASGPSVLLLPLFEFRRDG